MKKRKDKKRREERWRQRESNPNQITCKARALPIKLCPPKTTRGSVNREKGGEERQGKRESYWTKKLKREARERREGKEIRKESGELEIEWEGERERRRIRLK